LSGLDVPTGGDVIVAVDGEPLDGLDTLLNEIAMRNPGDEMDLTILRDGEQQELTVTLEARLQDFSQ
jgi:S1-C subfamily serine protease